METTHASPPYAQNSRWLQSSFPPTATWLLLNYSEHNPSHVQRHALSSQLYHISISSPYSQSLQRDLEHRKRTQYSMLQIKTILKNTFRLHTSWTFSFIYPVSFSEGLTNLARKQINIKSHAHYHLSSLKQKQSFPSLTITKISAKESCTDFTAYNN